ncbi:MAG: transposase [Kiritimatiellales bacterium]|nr:transposase [Kiritimatiellales bacterium]
MPRKPRIEYEGAVYHVMCRGNGGDAIFWDDKDRELFLDTLNEACSRCGWRIHAFVLMGNHYHLLLETPEANLVAGMKWFQGTYTQRFNSRNKRWGHLFQGRYKALVIDGAAGDYFSTVAGYIHLNPARAGLFDLKQEMLEAYPWSSYPLYLKPAKRPDWLCVDRVLGNFLWLDNPAGRKQYREHMLLRVLEISACDDPAECDAQWKEIRRGWFLGDEAFRKALLNRINDVVAGKQRSSFSGDQVLGHDETEAERWVQLGLKALGLADEQLRGMKKNCVDKYAIAWLVRRNTCVKNQWIKDRLKMGKATNFTTFLRRMEVGEFGAGQFGHVKSIKPCT